MLGAWLQSVRHRRARRTRVKGARHAYVEEDLVGRSELLVKSNPVFRKVPELIIRNGRLVCDSRRVVYTAVHRRGLGSHGKGGHESCRAVQRGPSEGNSENTFYNYTRT
ncbi:hypothetical protein PAHAL_9G405700 [Panicum hallii]|jgi:hypothetical protein|uniref:GST N-terminal domain-containing protein n=1 Tax=Panicum hallii TaxID=206008 RepID=A0A2T8I475_9POAL|nr:hypothetical protein PAHAL_9G405700 [Panicum hallii]